MESSPHHYKSKNEDISPKQVTSKKILFFFFFDSLKVKVLVAQSCPTLRDPWTVAH